MGLLQQGHALASVARCLLGRGGHGAAGQRAVAVPGLIDVAAAGAAGRGALDDGLVGREDCRGQGGQGTATLHHSFSNPSST